MRNFVEILRCPVTHEPLRWEGEDALITSAGVRYPYRDGVACLAPDAGASEPASTANVREFYESGGWEADEAGLFGDTKTFVDTRAHALSYTRKCMTRLGRHFRKGGRYLLDAGSGPVAHDELLDYGARYEQRVCVDLSAQGLRRARKKLGERGAYLQGDLTCLPIKTGSMDAITCNHVIYQLPDDMQLKAMLELWRVLKPGGVAVVVYWWWPYAPLPHRIERFAKAIGWGRGAVAGGGGEDPGLCHRPHERSWFEAQNWPFTYSYDTFRIVDNPFMRRYVPDDWRGSLFLQALYALQVAAPAFCGKHGAFPAIVIHKPSEAAQ